MPNTLVTSDQVGPDLDPIEAHFFGVDAPSHPNGMEPQLASAQPRSTEPVPEKPPQEAPTEDGSLALFGIETERPNPQPPQEVTNQSEQSEDGSEVAENDGDVLYVDEQGNPVDADGNPLKGASEEPLYYVGPDMDYGNDLEKFKKSHRDKEAFIRRQSSQLSAVQQSLQEKDSEMAALRAEFEAMQAAYFRGLSEDEHLERIALTQLPDELKNLKESDFWPDQKTFVPDRESFLDTYIKRALGGKTETDYEDDTVYKIERDAARKKAVAAFESAEKAGWDEYHAALRESAKKQAAYEAEKARIVERLRAERERTKTDILARQQEEQAIATAAINEIRTFASTQPLNFSDQELNAKSAGIVQNLGLVDEKGQITERFVLLQAQFGSELRDLVFEGIRQKVLKSRPQQKTKKVVVVPNKGLRSAPPASRSSVQEQSRTAEEQFKEVGWG